MDTCTIFANALDNAVRACSEIKEGERKIELSLKRKKDMLNIVVKNNIVTIISIKVSGTLKSVINPSFCVVSAVKIVCRNSMIFYNLH